MAVLTLKLGIKSYLTQLILRRPLHEARYEN